MSAPGIGKSSIIAAFAASHNLPFKDTRLAYASPTDVRGFPFLADNNGVKTMEFAAPSDYPTQDGTVWALDEFSCASRQTQNASLQLLLEGRIGEYVCPKDTFIVLAGNRAQDKAHVEKLSAAVINRICLITLRPDLDDWTNWAINNEIDPRVIAFLRFRPGLLSDFDAPTWDSASGFASPRSWEFASRVMASEPPATIRLALLNGLLGQGAATEFSAFLNVFSKVPSIDAILADPERAAVPRKPDEVYAVAAGLAVRLSKDNIDRGILYMERLSKDFQVFIMRLAGRRDSAIIQSASGLKWFAANKDILVG